MARKKKPMEVSLKLQRVTRKQIRYILFRLKNGGKKKELTLIQQWIWDDVKKFYSSQPNFTSFEEFNDTWDIGTDDPNILNNWDDPARSDCWWTWGISKFKIVKRVGMTYAINTDEGITKSFPGIIDYFVAQGFAKADGKGGHRIDVNKFMAEVETRDRWIPLLETDYSLKDGGDWQQHYYKYDIELKEKMEE